VSLPIAIDWDRAAHLLKSFKVIRKSDKSGLSELEKFKIQNNPRAQDSCSSSLVMSEAAQEVPSTENSRAIFTRLDTEFHESHVTHKTMTPNGVTITEAWEKHDLEDSRLTVERERRTGQLRVVKKILVDDHGRSRRRFYSGLEQLHAISLELEKVRALRCSTTKKYLV
jgi:hypothetical protein